MKKRWRWTNPASLPQYEALRLEPDPVQRRERVAVILVNWNSWRDTTECLSSLLASHAMRYSDVFLVDNASSDGSVAKIVEWCNRPVQEKHPVFDGVRHLAGQAVVYRVARFSGDALPDPQGALTIIEAGTNLGFAGGNNVGLIVAGLDRYSHFWFLNTDTVVHGDALQHLLDRSALDNRVGMVGSTLIHYHAPDTVQALGGGRLRPRNMSVTHIGEGIKVADVPTTRADAVEGEMAYVVGASMLVTREFVDSVGLMEEDYFLYFEEIDWAMRARGRFKLAFAPLSRVYHKVGGSSTRVVSEFSLTLLYKNRLRFVRRFVPESLASTRLSLIWELGRHVLRGRWRAAGVLAHVLRDDRRRSAGSSTSRSAAT